VSEKTVIPIPSVVHLICQHPPRVVVRSPSGRAAKPAAGNQRRRDRVNVSATAAKRVP
jgi:hypothetical protein